MMEKIIFKSGVSNKSFLKDNLVVRINSDVSNNPFINRVNEKKVIELCSSFTTQILEINDEKLVTKYEQLYQYDFASNVTKIIDLMKQMHSKKVEHIFNPFDIIDNTKLEIQYNNKLYQEVKKHWESSEKVLCHNDLLLANIIFNGTKFKLIDFEYSGMNSKYFDLASLISENNLWDHKLNIAKQYGDIDLEILDMYVFLNDLLWVIWGTELGHDELVADKKKRLSEY